MKSSLFVVKFHWNRKTKNDISIILRCSLKHNISLQMTTVVTATALPVWNSHMSWGSLWTSAHQDDEQCCCAAVLVQGWHVCNATQTALNLSYVHNAMNISVLLTAGMIHLLYLNTEASNGYYYNAYVQYTNNFPYFSSYIVVLYFLRYRSTFNFWTGNK